MAEFCSICLPIMYDPETSNDVFADIVFQERYYGGGDFNIDKIYEEDIKPKINHLLEGNDRWLNIGGICEHCGLLGLTVRKEENILYLICGCYKDDGIKRYKIAVINENMELGEFIIDEIKKMYND